MKFWFDTEFVEDGVTIDLLSIGIVAEDGREFYAEIREADHSKACPWVRENVLPHLTGDTKSRLWVACQIIEFVGPAPEFWAWYGAYDWVALCQLYGRMVNLPKGWPMFVRDVRQLIDGPDLPPDLPKQVAGTHNALEDAKHTWRMWEHLTGRGGI